MLNIKKTISHIIRVFTGAENIEMSSGEPGIRVRRTDTDVMVGFIVGMGGTNHGIYSYELNKWLIHGDASNVYVDGRKLDLDTNNTSDTWVPVLKGNSIQHRVIPSDASATATNTNTSKWTGGSILLYRKGNCCTIKFNGVAHPQITGRTAIGTIPAGFRPPYQLEVLGFNTNSSSAVSIAQKFILDTNGTISIDPCASSTIWASASYCV